MAISRQLIAPHKGKPVGQADSRIFRSARKDKMTSTNIRVRSALATDAEVIAGIYNHYIQNTVITFEEERVSA